MSSTKPRKKLAAPDTSSPLAAFFLRTLLVGYYPFLALIVILSAAATAWLGMKAYDSPSLAPILALPVLVLALTLLQLLWALRVLFVKLKDFDDEMELRVPRVMAPQLYEWVQSIATERGLPMPDDIRVAADTVAHVYERADGQHVLVLGVVAVRALPQPVLAGIVAHELGHLGAGDTALGRRALRRHILMRQLAIAFHVERDALLRRGGGVSSLAILGATLNPAVWAVRLYHLLYALAHAAHSRQCEYAADRQEVKQSGAESAAQALILLTVAERMPWTRLSSLAESWVATNEPAHLIFAQQERAARATSPGEWQDAIRKELKRPTGAFDSHPALKQRLAALGVSPKKAVQLTPGLTGPPAHKLFDQWWPKLEKQLAQRLLAPYREAHLAKMEVGELVGALESLRGRTR
jgi:Zn-dependent protease with chaperone function